MNNTNRDELIELTPENREHIARMLAATTGGAMKWGPLEEFDEKSHAAIKAMTGGQGCTWVTWQKRDDGDYYTAVTGNGPTAAANAEFYSVARRIVLSLLDENAALRRQVAELEERRLGDLLVIKEAMVEIKRLGEEVKAENGLREAHVCDEDFLEYP